MSDYIVDIEIGITARDRKTADKIRAEICRLIASNVRIDSYHASVEEVEE